MFGIKRFYCAHFRTCIHRICARLLDNLLPLTALKILEIPAYFLCISEYVFPEWYKLTIVCLYSWLYFTFFEDIFIPPAIINSDGKSMTLQPWFKRTYYISYNVSSDWTDVFLLGTYAPVKKTIIHAFIIAFDFAGRANHSALASLSRQNR